MSKKALDPINILTSAGAPTVPTIQAGDTYFDTSANAMYVYTGSAWVLSVPAGTTSAAGVLQLTDSTSSTSTTTAATPNSVKTAYDTATASVQTTRTISTTAPIAGGGNLSADRTLSLNTGSSLTTSGSNLVVDSTIVPFLASANTFTAKQTIQPTSTTDNLLYLFANNNSQNVLATDFTGSGSGNQVSLTAGGTLGLSNIGSVTVLNSSITPSTATFNGSSGTIISTGSTTTNPSLRVRGVASQTADLVQFTLNNGTDAQQYLRINNNGQIEGTTPANPALVVKQATTTYATTLITAGNPTTGKVRYRYSSSYQVFQVGQSVTITGATPSGYNGTFTITDISTATAGSVYYFSVTNATTGTATVQGLVTPAYPADLQQWRNTSNAVIAAIGANGTMAMGTTAGAPTIASATTIAPVTPILFISGTTAIVTITAPAPISTNGGSIVLIPTGAFTTTTAGNIALASTAVVSRTMTMTYDPITTKWYPSY
jgi:hypothetical protein